MFIFFKRIMDIVLASISLIILSPLTLIIALLIKFDSEGPVLFKQKRIGYRKKCFTIYKFRTMSIKTPKDEPTHLLVNPGQYITKVGKILRKTSLDELPQLINILIGDMSLIGPRPALWNQFDLVAERDKYIDTKGKTANDIKPGLTGWAQINGRDELPIDVKARLDGEYVRDIGIRMDARCFFGTIIYVIKGNGILEGGVERSNGAEHSENKGSDLR